MDANIVKCTAAHYYGFYTGSPAFSLFVQDPPPPFLHAIGMFRHYSCWFQLVVEVLLLRAPCIVWVCLKQPRSWWKGRISICSERDFPIPRQSQHLIGETVARFNGSEYVWRLQKCWIMNWSWCLYPNPQETLVCSNESHISLGVALFKAEEILEITGDVYVEAVPGAHARKLPVFKKSI